MQPIVGLRSAWQQALAAIASAETPEAKQAAEDALADLIRRAHRGQALETMDLFDPKMAAANDGGDE